MSEMKPTLNMIVAGFECDAIERSQTDRDAYEGAREDLLAWKHRALSDELLADAPQPGESA